MGRVQSPATNLFDADIRAQLHIALDQMLEQHGTRVSRAIEDSETRKRTINLPLTIDCSKSSPSYDMGFKFIPERINDSRQIKAKDDNQGEFDITSPAQMEALEKAAAAKAKKDKAEPKPGSDLTHGEVASRMEGRAKKSAKPRKPKAGSDEAE